MKTTCWNPSGISFLLPLWLQVASPEAADLQVDFFHGYHGDGYPFDGAGGAVGHAFFPSDPSRAGGVHLDAEEEWAFRQPGGAMFTKLKHWTPCQPTSTQLYVFVQFYHPETNI